MIRIQTRLMVCPRVPSGESNDVCGDRLLGRYVLLLAMGFAIPGLDCCLVPILSSIPSVAFLNCHQYLGYYHYVCHRLDSMLLFDEYFEWYKILQVTHFVWSRCL